MVCACRTIEVVKSPAPGKQAIKDSILEAEEAWTVLHRRRRSAGIVPRAATRTLSAARPPAASAVGGDDEDVALLTTADATTGADLVSQDSDIDEKDSQVNRSTCHGYLMKHADYAARFHRT